MRKMSEQQITSEDIVYISGTMTGQKYANREAFAAAESEIVKRYKCRVINPASGMPDGLEYTQYMAHALLLLSHATAVVFLPGHENSVSSNIEETCAARDGKKTFELNIPKDAER